MNQSNATEKIFEAITADDLDVMHAALDAGADPNADDGEGFGETPLMLAVDLGRRDAAVLLLDRRAAVNDADDFGETPLMKAVKKGDAAAVRLLLDRGADVYALDHDDKNAMAYTRDAETAALLRAAEEVHARTLAENDAAALRGHRAVLDATTPDKWSDWDRALRAAVYEACAAQEARELAAALPAAHDDPMSRPARRPIGTREPESVAPARSHRPRL